MPDVARFVLTNDDGIDAPGIEALRNAVDDECIVVAPHEHLSGCSHRVTTHERPLQVDERGPAAYAVTGTPADCTRVALHHLGCKPEFVLSGINAGGNLGWDIYPSGTVAAVREAAYLGVPGLAISQYFKPRITLDWNRTSNMARRVIAELLAETLSPGEFWNVNLPHLEANEPEPAIVRCEPCRQPLPVAYRAEGGLLHYSGNYAKRSRDPGADVEQCFAGNITVSRIRI